MSFSSFAVGGSRALPAWPLVASFVRRALAAGASLSVGCASGADAAVVAGVLAAGGAARLSVFAAFASSGAGSWRCSAVGAVRAAAAAGARVAWLAGGALSVPLVARLFARSCACVRSVGPGGAAVFFLASPSSPGSLAVAGFAAGLGLPVFAFSCGFAGAPAAPRGCAGAWAPASLFGLPCWVWSPAAVRLPGFGPAVGAERSAGLL